MNTKNHNIGLLPQSEQDNINLQKQAALLIYNYKRHISSRRDIEQAIEAVADDKRDVFKRYLNNYKGIATAIAEQWS